MKLGNCIKITKILHNIYIKNRYFIRKKSYSMNREDIFVSKFFKFKNNGFYVDVGAYHPLELNNTYLLHKKGWNGINIDINPLSIDYFNFLRPDDVNINIAISNKKKSEVVYYQKEKSPLNTLNLKHANRVFGRNKYKKRKTLTNNLTSVLNKTKYKNKKIDFLNIDIEGLDLNALKGLNFKTYRPKLICVEIPDYVKPSIDIIKKQKIYKFLNKKRYKLVWSGYFSNIFKYKN